MKMDGLGLHQLATARLLKTAQAIAVPAAEHASALAERTAARAVVTPASPLSAGAMPVDVERVAQIRKAVESGAYPLVPAKIADAMIAAGMLLTAAKAQALPLDDGRG